MDLAELIYRCSDDFPRREQFGLASQLRRAAVSVPSNIAEGQGRLSRGEWLHFLGIARASLYEIETQLTIAARLEFIDRANADHLAALTKELCRSLTRLIHYVRSRGR